MNDVIIIATGDELVEGFVQETNSTYYSQKLVSQGICVKKIIITRDTIEEIESALYFAAQSKPAAIIISGGLGPTSDDLTRFALANHLKRELVTDQNSLEHIKSRLQRFALVYTPNNEQQALFPKDSIILRNDYGTANGCHTPASGIDYFMLPGPPNEARPMFDSFVIPKIKHFGKTIYRKCFTTIGHAEAFLARKFEPIAKSKNLKIGYCYHYPYVDCKVESLEPIEFNDLELRDLFSNRLVSDNGSSAVTKLTALIADLKAPLSSTKTNFLWSFNSALINQETIGYLNNSRFLVDISGLDEFWMKRPFEGRTSLTVKVSDGDQLIHSDHIDFPYRGPEALDFAIHFAAFVAYTGIRNYI